jgi:hypothetical protein
MARRKPDWSLYPRAQSYPLWVLCALSCDIDPETIDLDKDREDPELELFWARLDSATRAVQASRLQAKELN